MSAVTSPPPPDQHQTTLDWYVLICDQIVSRNFTVMATKCGSLGAYFCATYSSNGLLKLNIHRLEKI